MSTKSKQAEGKRSFYSIWGVQPLEVRLMLRNSPEDQLADVLGYDVSTGAVLAIVQDSRNGAFRMDSLNDGDIVAMLPDKNRTIVNESPVLIEVADYLIDSDGKLITNH